MKSGDIKSLFLKSFDAVGIIRTATYLEEAKQRGKDVPHENYPTMVVLGLAYPYRTIKQTKTHVVPSFYTFGQDYHQVLSRRIEDVMKLIPYKYHLGVDNHPHDERLAAVLAGIGFFGKNQLIIHPELGSYFFLGIVWIDVSIDQEIILDIDDDCGTCTKCIDACPTHALEEGKYHIDRCMSYFNQTKKILTEEEIKANYCLFGCDICQMVCPKNIKKGVITHPEFELSGKEMVSIEDLFTLSEKAFKMKYQDMSYLWKGKTILMRNAAILLLRQQNDNYIDLLEASMQKHEMPWYQVTLQYVIEKLKNNER